MMVGSPGERMRAVIDMAQNGHFEEIRDVFLEQLRPMVSAESLRAAWSAEIGHLGAISAIGTPAPAASEPVQHVDPTVISDMTDWITGIRSSNW